MVNSPRRKSKETPPSEEAVRAEQELGEALESLEQEFVEAEHEAQETTTQEEETPMVTELADAPVNTPQAASAPVLDPVAKKIEQVLEEDLTDLYLKMTPTEQLAFKQKGEETASQIRQLFEQAKLNAKKIFQLLREWLKLIPGVNRFFLEQEAKIKTDRLVLMHEQEQKQTPPSI